MVLDEGLEQYALGEGEASFIPAGYVHYMENASDREEAVVFFAFSDASNESFGVGASLKALPPAVVAQGLGVSEADVRAIPKSQPLLR